MIVRLLIAVVLGLAAAFGALAVRGEDNGSLTIYIIHLPVVKGEEEGPPGEEDATPSPEPQDTSTPQPPTASTTPTATVTSLPSPSSTPTPSPSATPTRTTAPTATPTRTPTATRTAKPTATATPSPTAVPTSAPPPGGANVRCVSSGNAQICAWVSDATPRQYTDVTTFGRLIVNGSPVANAPMHTIWKYRTTTSTEDCTTNVNGIGRCTRYISGATVGYEVIVDVEIKHGSTTYKTYTSFTPR